MNGVKSVKSIRIHKVLKRYVFAYAYELQNPFVLNNDNSSKKACQNKLSHPCLSHSQQERQESLI